MGAYLSLRNLTPIQKDFWNTMVIIKNSQIDRNGYVNEDLLRCYSFPSVTQQINKQKRICFFSRHSLVCCFTFLLVWYGPYTHNLWHKLSLDTLKNLVTSNRKWSVGEKLNLRPKLIEVSQNLTLLEETLLWLSIYSTKKVQRNMF